MVKDHSDSERGNPLPLHGLHFPISSKGSFICIIHGICYTSRGALAGMRNSLSRRIKPKEKYVRISMKEIWRNLYGPPKNKNCGAI